MIKTQSYDIIQSCTPILSADPTVKEDVMLDQQKITIIYCRLSVEDIKEDAKGGKADESNSIQNQEEYLTRYAKEHGDTNLKILVDDGYTGTNFNRPGVQEGFELVKQGLVGCWLVKDLSRFGRDYLTVGQYTDIIFPSYDVRFIAVNDGVDSERGDSEGMAAIRNLFNDWYPRDTSKKVRVSLHQRGTSGKHMGKPPYGYRCDPEDKEHWILDEEADFDRKGSVCQTEEKAAAGKTVSLDWSICGWHSGTAGVHRLHRQFQDLFQVLQVEKADTQ